MVHTVPGLRLAHAYLVERPDGLAVIDPGYTGSHGAVLRFVARLGFQPQDLRWVILTHHHVDHGGCVSELCRRTGAQLAVHVDDAPYLGPGRPRDRSTLWGGIDRLPSALARFLITCAEPPAILLRGADEVGGLQVLHTPGHTPGSICLWSKEESALFLGDLLNNQRGLRRPPWNVNHDHRKARRAGRALLGLTYECAYFGHGPPLLEGASKAISRFVESVLGREEQTRTPRQRSR